MGARFAGGAPHSDAHVGVLPPLHRHVHRRAIPYRLVDHAITLGQLEKPIELILRGVGFDREVLAPMPTASLRRAPRQGSHLDIAARRSSGN